MKKLTTLLTALVFVASSYAQSIIKPFEIHYKDETTDWEFVSVGGDETPYLYFYFNNQTDVRRKLTKVTIANGWKDHFTITSTGEYTREESGVKWMAVDREGTKCSLEILTRVVTKGGVNFKYTQLYIRYNNIEYVYSFIIN